MTERSNDGDVGVKTSGTAFANCVICRAPMDAAIPLLAVMQTPMHPFRPPQEAGSKAGFGRLDIRQCPHCGHICNAAFDPDETGDLYGAFVLTNTPVSESMVNSVMETANAILSRAIPDADVLEIGGGAGALSLAMSKNARQVNLVEPSRALSADRFKGTKVVYHRSMYPNAALAGRQFDVVVCRQVLEHVPSPDGFLQALRGALRSDGLAYIEIPCAEYIVRNRSIVDFHYPHVHYYSRAGAISLLRRAGFEVIDSVSVKDGHDVGFFLKPIEPQPNAGLHGKGEPIDETEFSAVRDRGRRRLNGGGDVVLYGANAYSQSFLGLYPDFVPKAIFDDTPLYAGQRAYGPTQDIAIGPPSVERLERIGSVIITAYLHDLPIAKKLRALGYGGNIFTVRSDETAGTGDRPTSLFA